MNQENNWDGISFQKFSSTIKVFIIWTKRLTVALLAQMDSLQDDSVAGNKWTIHQERDGTSINFQLNTGEQVSVVPETIKLVLKEKPQATEGKQMKQGLQW